MSNIKNIMFDKKIKQNKMAMDLGINKTTLNNYVNGNTQPDNDTLIKMANYLDVSLDYMLGRVYNNNVGYIPDDRKDLVKKVLLLNDKQAEKADGYISALIDND